MPELLNTTAYEMLIQRETRIHPLSFVSVLLARRHSRLAVVANTTIQVETYRL
jgi:hypothetical protein